MKKGRPAHVLDVGTGTGILAFAAAKALHQPVHAGDLDPEAVSTAKGNARLKRTRQPRPALCRTRRGAMRAPTAAAASM